MKGGGAGYGLAHEVFIKTSLILSLFTLLFFEERRSWKDRKLTTKRIEKGKREQTKEGN